MKARILVAAAAAALLCAPTSASARSLVVDDDAGCADAAFTTIQSAIDAASSGDVVRVCPGVYDEIVTVPATLDALKLVSRVRHAAVIRPPAQAQQFGAGVIELAARKVLLRGFTVRGPFALGADGCRPDAAIFVQNGLGGAFPPPQRVTIDHNRLVDLSCPVQDPDAPTRGVWSDQTGRLIVAHNEISGYDGAGVDHEFSDDLTVHDNDFDGSGGPRTTAVSVDRFAADVKIASNDIVDHAVGLVYDGFEAGGLAYSATGNRLRRNGIGLIAEDHGLGDHHGFPPLPRLIANRVLDSGTIGIRVTGLALVRRNSSLGSGVLDCQDTRGEGQWTDNVGTTDEPATICREP